ncbi:putative hemolysin [Yersinia frederiksenii]|nr:putative hemolysin [Yersinia frederiksenii]
MIAIKTNANIKFTPPTDPLSIYRDKKTIYLDNLSLDNVFFHYSNSELIVTILDSDKNVLSEKHYEVVKNKNLIINSIILREKNGVKNELFLTLKEPYKEKNVYDGPNKYLLLTRKDLPYISAQNIISNTIPLKEVILNDNERLLGEKYIRNGVTGGKGNNTIIGGDKNDNLAGGDGNDIIFGHDSFDSLFGQNGNDVLVGGAGDDGLAGGDGDDYLDGGDGDDELQGDADGLGLYAAEYQGCGNDNIYGGKGNDLIIGGRNNDYLAGGEGDDLYGFSPSDGINLINEHSGEENTISILDRFFHQLNFERYGNHLVISGDEEKSDNLIIIIKDQYSKNGYKVKNLQTKSYLKHGSENDKKRQKKLLDIMVKQYANTPEKALSQLATKNDLGDFYRTDLSIGFSNQMPDLEKLKGTKLVDVLKVKNDQRVSAHKNQHLHSCDNIPDISQITFAISYFSPKDISQENSIYLKHDNNTQDYFSNKIAAINH